MEYYSRKSGGKKEPLLDHLYKTSNLCESFTQIFDMPVTGRVLGRLHDIGKRTKKFQDVLFANRIKVNHAIVAGQYLNQCLGKVLPDFAHIITSHHYGLHKDWPFNPDFSNPLSLMDIENKENSLSSEAEYDDIKQWLVDNHIELTRDEAMSMLKEYQRVMSKTTTKNERMFINRMIYSCLVDADYSSSASFGDPTYLKTYDGNNLEPDAMLSNLAQYRAKLIASSTSNSELNKLRNEVFDACTTSGQSNYGNYTLTAPTGTAKTLATLEFALQNAKFNKKQRIIFVLPYLSIIDQSAKIYKEICGEDNVLEDDSQTEFTEKSKLFSDRWSSPIIVTTSVNLFETLFKREGSDLRKLHNISNSVIVFDESQTIPNYILDATLKVISTLNKKFNVTTLFSTATPPSFDYRENVNWEAHEIIHDPQDLFDRYEKTKKLSVEWRLNEEFDSEKLLKMVSGQQSYLFIFNLKRHANDFYKVLKESLSEKELDGLFYISTNLCSDHRTLTLAQIRNRLKNGLPTKVISTQCLEAGVDLDFELVYRAMGPATSIAQAAGRCSRNALTPGRLTVFMPAGSKLYPDNNYKNSTLQLQSMISSNGDFNINSLRDIDEYYKLVFHTHGLDVDDKNLTEAINRFSYEDVEDAYRFIKSQGSTVIVPYAGCNEQYHEIKNEIISNDYCINKSLMAKLRKITVTSYDRKNVETYCQPLYFRINGEKVPCNWFLLDETLNMYDKQLGLDFSNSNEFIF